jgi:putative drug exporter of the RND superfamily
MLQLLGNWVSRYWFVVLPAWLLTLGICWWVAPPWTEVAQDREFAFLPANVPSRTAEDMYDKAFPDDHLASNIVLVLHRSQLDKSALSGDLKFIEDTLEPGLREIANADGGLAVNPAAPPADEPLFGDKPAAPDQPAATGAQAPPKRSIMASIRTPNDPEAGPLLVSDDRQALLVVIELTTEFLARDNWPTIDKIRGLIDALAAQQKIPAGMDITMTGSAMIGRDHVEGEMQSARATEVLTIVLVISLLLLIYRAPLIALIPLITVYLVVQLSIHALSILAKFGSITLFEGIQIYITILTYGAGVDYCIFFTARYREELEAGTSPAEAVSRAISGVGAAITASAATVIIGIGMMVFAQFGKFHEAGYAIPFSIFLVLCASLTFSPALLRLAGHWAFWPRHVDKLERTEPAVGSEPGRLEGHLDTLGRIWDWVGHHLLNKPGRLWLTSIAVMVPFVIVGYVFGAHLSYDLIADLPSDSTSVKGTKLLERHFPSGILAPITVLLVDPATDFNSDAGRAEVESITGQLRARQAELGLADIRTLTSPLGITEAGHRQVRDLKIPEAAREEGMRRAALERYATDFGERRKTGTRLELVLQNSPFSQESIKALGLIEEAVAIALPTKSQANTRIFVSGSTASVRDLATVMQTDRLRIQTLVLIAVFVILVALLREFTVPLYLLISVLFSYYVTLGVTYLLFRAISPGEFAGLDWKVGIFLFTILIAVGEDYNIFLITRVRDEEKQHGPLDSVIHALVRTGPIISNCGIIMAGTFAALMAGQLAEMKQLGFALCFGVLLDTFVVRTIVVPAFLILQRTGKLSPANWFKKSTNVTPALEPTAAAPGSRKAL